MESRTYRVALTSADPKILNLFVKWLKQYYAVDKEQLRVRLHIWPETDETIAKNFWSQQLDVSQKNFTKSWSKPRGNRAGKRLHSYGICRVSLSSKELLNKILYDIQNELEC